jgi:hypothetical protein
MFANMANWRCVILVTPSLRAKDSLRTPFARGCRYKRPLHNTPQVRIERGGGNICVPVFARRLFSETGAKDAGQLRARAFLKRGLVTKNELGL